MNTPADSLTPAVLAPRRVYVALALLWVAWAITACALSVRVLFFGLRFGGSGFVAVSIEALLIYFIGRRSNVARIVMLIAVLLSTAAGSWLLTALAQRSISAIPAIVGYLLRVPALVLLFSGESRPWFKGSQAGEGGL